MLWFYYTYFLSLAGSQWKIVATGSGIIWFWPRVQNPEGVQEDLGGGLESREATLPAQPLHNFLSSRNSILKHLVAYLEFWHLETLKSWDPAHQRETHLEDVQGEGGCGGS